MGGRGVSSASSKGKLATGKASPMTDKQFKKLKDFLKNKHGITLDASVKQLDHKMVKQGISGIDKVLNEFPQMAGCINEIFYDKNCSSDTLAYTQYKYDEQKGTLCTQLAFTKYFADKTSISNSAARWGNWHPPNHDARAIMAHETGHALETALANKKGITLYERVIIKAKGKCSTRIFQQACKKIKKTSYGKGKTNDELVRAVSGYAGHNKRKLKRMEAFAECISDYVTNGKSSNLLSQAVWDIVKKEMS
jgi:hypothetical protein